MTEDFDWTLGLYGSHSKNIKEMIFKGPDQHSSELWRAVSALFCVCNLYYFFLFYV